MKQAILMNIGNFHTEIAVCNGKCIDIKETLQTKSLLSTLPLSRVFRDFSGLPCLAACVVPLVKEQLTGFSPLKLVHWVTVDMDLGLDFSTVDKSTVGADRIANAVAAVNEHPLPVIIIDCGTAITMEVVDVKKRFLGGSILPGRYLSRWALTEGTGQLLMAPYSVDIPEAIGKNTSDAIRSGIDLGLLGAVERILDGARDTINEPNLTAIVVGGDRHFFSKNLNHVRLGPDDFTLKGLALIADRL